MSAGPAEGGAVKKKWMGAVLAAALLAGGTAGADDLTLPTGEVLPFGSRVAVWQGHDSYFAEKIDAVLVADPALVDAIAKNYIQMGVYGESEKADARRMAEAVADIFRESRTYQLRSTSGNTMYTAYVLSLPMKLPLTETDILRWNEWVKAFGEKNGVSPEAREALSRHGELSQSVALAVEMMKNAVRKNGTSAGGDAYQLAYTQMTPAAYDYAVPLWLCVLGTTKKDGNNLTVTVLLADQASGRYFAPLVEKAVEAAR